MSDSIAGKIPAPKLDNEALRPFDVDDPATWPDRVCNPREEARNREAVRLHLEGRLTWGEIARQLNESGYPRFTSASHVRVTAQRYARRVYGKPLPRKRYT
jgi:hypothetical protein